MLTFLLPGYGIASRRRAERFRGDGLIMLRQVILSFCGSLVLFGVVLLSMYPSSVPPREPPNTFIIGLLTVGALNVIVVGRRIERPLDCTDDGKLASTYRTRFFLRIAFAQAAAMFGFVGFFATYAWWPYPVGLAICAIGFVRAAPTRRNLERDQERLAEASCFRPLVRALRSAMPPLGT